MKIKSKMIYHELRLPAYVAQKCCRIRKERTFFTLQHILGLLLPLRSTTKLLCKQVYLQRKDSSALRLCIYKPLEEKKNAVGVLWIHGGGYALGAPEQDLAYAEKLIGVSDCVVVMPEYRLSTEAPYPAALKDCYAALLWLKKNAKKLGVRDDQIFVGGESAGGGLTVALCAYARDHGSVNIAFQMPLYPMLDDREKTGSSRNNTAPIWDSTGNQLAWKLYLGDLYKKDKIPVYAAPARLTDYSGLPPAYSFVGDIEVFFDETRQYFRQLKKAGIPAQLTIYPGCFHAFDFAFGQMKISKRATALFLKKYKFATEHYYAKQDN